MSKDQSPNLEQERNQENNQISSSEFTDQVILDKNQTKSLIQPNFKRPELTRINEEVEYIEKNIIND